ncbi:MAG: hypothetical protein N838_14150 [Thiohalocapsa sp. PB-PSB1]|jgi:ABC-type polysaccharide/polyol phosphate transport system ATPase subunit|nr:MAG: hypothetical protein N838_14150 [Thiohalocapsa sp. PB-PSB1]
MLVTHSPLGVRRLCNRAVWIDNGVSRMEGEVTEVLAAYTERYPPTVPRGGPIGLAG